LEAIALFMEFFHKIHEFYPLDSVQATEKLFAISPTLAESILDQGFFSGTPINSKKYWRRKSFYQKI
jgi:hypothetical protein